MTGATGDLTPEAPDEAFDPGERREISDAAHHADVTVAQSHRTTSSPSDVAGEDDRSTGSAGAEGGHDRDSRIGGDERVDHEEHF